MRVCGATGAEAPSTEGAIRPLKGSIRVTIRVTIKGSRGP